MARARERERERENKSPGFEANMWESGREVVFRFKWDGVTEPNAKAVGWTQQESLGQPEPELQSVDEESDR
ncbi:hypothetical protein N7481_004422 [Penicillium waksmanii]|uniref:uncharacterized protein n=1 Tax=Penicillium waksmanii TaxID=69791 RepID=UPI0025471700|nr:uncharacterized protein N7481_004422 [Penicillium waksmanii]KAJ5989212.1 hypothetical protein N7481_004422 [Penicillium waksmanii]